MLSFRSSLERRPIRRKLPDERDAENSLETYVDEYLPRAVEAVRRDFLILDVRIGSKPLVYFDNAATTHKPQVVNV